MISNGVIAGPHVIFSLELRRSHQAATMALDINKLCCGISLLRNIMIGGGGGGRATHHRQPACALLSWLVLILSSCLLTFVSSKTDPSDVSALNVMYMSMNSPHQLNTWKSNGGDPCGESWKGITCSGSKVTKIHLKDNQFTGSINVLANLPFDDLCFDLCSPSRRSSTSLIEIHFVVNLQDLAKNVENKKFTGWIPDELSNIKKLETGGNSWSSPGAKNGAAIAGIVLGVLVVLGIIIAVFARRRSVPPPSHFLEEDRLSQHRSNRTFSGVEKNYIQRNLFFLLVCSLLRLGVSIQSNDYFLDEFKKSLPNGGLLNRYWVLGTDPCNTRVGERNTWIGVNCDGHGNVRSIELEGWDFSGELDVNPLEKLPKLRGIILRNNKLVGRIPAFNRLSALEHLNLAHNKFVGEIPDDFFVNMTSLVSIDLSFNELSGDILSSLESLFKLQDLNLRVNSFSGRVPLLKQPSLKRLDLSFNGLRGRIPKDMVKFGDEAFKENPRLCGPPLANYSPCEPHDISPPPPSLILKAPLLDDPGDVNPKTKWVLLVVFGLVLWACRWAKVVQDRENALDREIRRNAHDSDDEEEMMQMDTGTGSRSRRIIYSYSGNMEREEEEEEEEEVFNYNDSSMRLDEEVFNYNDSSSSHSSSRRPEIVDDTDLVIVNDHKGRFRWNDLMKAGAEQIGSQILSSTYRSVMANGLEVVVKRLIDTNKLDRDEFEAELRRLGGIRHKNILPPLAYRYQPYEKLFVYEFIPRGSLLAILHGNEEKSQSTLDWFARLKIIKGIARGMGFLHTTFSDYLLPHGNLKSSNILISENNEPLLTDYALFQLIGDTSMQSRSLFAYRCPEVVLYHHVSPKCDTYCFGIVILEIMTGEFPSQYLDGSDKGETNLVIWLNRAIAGNKVQEMIDPQISATVDVDSVEQMIKMFYIAAACTESDHEKRIEMKEAIRKINEVQP